MMRPILLKLPPVVMAVAVPLFGQTLYVPGGTVGSISGSNVGIGTTGPSQKLTVAGNINKSGSWIVGDFAWGANTFEIHSNSWDGTSNADYGGLAAGHGYFYGGLQSGGSSGGEAGAGQLYVSGLTMLLGNVGIGTTTPGGYKLDVKASSSTDAVAIFEGNSSYGGYTTYQDAYSGATRGFVGYGATLFSGMASTDFGIRSQGSIALGSSGYVFQYISSSGNIGIGTTSPVAKLTVIGNPGSPSTSSDNGVTAIGATNGVQLSMGIPNSIPYGIFLQTKDANNSGPYHYPILLNPVDGNVGIGTTNPGTYKLAVNGQIHAKEVVVDNTGWSDYVFDENYKLKALSEVEAYVKAEHHLPGVPSAQEVEEHGVSIGEMQSKLLAKVEELTLHLIAQEKQLAAQQEEIRALRAARP